MLKESTLQMVRGALASLHDPVRLVLFTSDVDCDACPSALELASAIKAASPKIALETYDSVMDRDKSSEYGIQRVPAFVVQGKGVKAVTFSGAPEGLSLVLLLDAIAGVANGRAWFPERIGTALAHLQKDVPLRVVIENDCSLCRPAAETAVGLALTSRLITAEVIVADDFPAYLAKHRIKLLPFTSFGDVLHQEGHLDEGAFLEMIYRAEGLRGKEPDKRCVVCGSPSPDMICGGCRTRIQAEAVNHKRKDERFGERGMGGGTEPHAH